MYFSNYYSRIKNTKILGDAGEIRFIGWLDPIPPKGFQKLCVSLKDVFVISISSAYVRHSSLTP